MLSDLDLIAKLLSAVITAVVAAVVKQYFEQRPNLLTYLVHVSAIPLNPVTTAPPSTAPSGTAPPSTALSSAPVVNSHAIVVRNAGKRAARNVRIGHYFLPPSFQINPPVSHTVIHGSNNSAEIVIPVLVPSDQVSISYLYFPPLVWTQINAYTKSDEGMAKTINVIPTPQPSKWFLFVIWALVLLGAFTAIYWVFLLVMRMLFQSA